MSREDIETADEQAIPLLDDVVDPDELEFSERSQDPGDQQMPDPQAIVEVLREGVVDQLIRDLQPIITVAVETAITQVTQQARQLLLDELNGSLENHIRSLIVAAVEREFMTKE